MVVRMKATLTNLREYANKLAMSEYEIDRLISEVEVVDNLVVGYDDIIAGLDAEHEQREIERELSTYHLYDDGGNEIMQCTDRTLCDAINWIYDHGQGYIVDGNGKTVEC
mgnify:CR=1 FL=1